MRHDGLNGIPSELACGNGQLGAWGSIDFRATSDCFIGTDAITSAAVFSGTRPTVVRSTNQLACRPGLTMTDESSAHNPDATSRDAELVRRARRGDAEAFEALYRAYSPWALRLARRFAPDDDAAQDVVQDAFLYLLDRLPRLELQGKLTTFLYPVVKHRALDLKRKRRPDLSLNLDAESSPNTPATPQDKNPALHLAVERLPEAQREVLLMRCVDDMKLAEIAAALSIPLGTAKSRLHHAIEALRQDGAIRRDLE